MIIKTNQQYLNSTMQELLMNGLKLGKNASKNKDVYPTPSGLNVKIPQNPFIKTQLNAIVRYHKEADYDTVFNSIPDGYTTNRTMGFCDRESKQDLTLIIAKRAVKARFGNYFKDLKVKIGELITPPHLYLKDPKLKPHYYIDELWSLGKDTGTNAIKSVVLQSLKDSDTQGRVMLDACCIDGFTSPVGFYYKLGFRATDPSINEKCAKWLSEGGKKETSPQVAATMYLPRENVQHCLNYGLDIKA